MRESKSLAVFMGDRKVGTLAVTKERLTAFAYDAQWLESGFSISPLSLPLKKEVFVPKGYEPFEGVFGVFADSLPDGWGRLLVDRMLRREGIDPDRVDALNRLAIVGTSGMGALTYHPEAELNGDEEEGISLDELARDCERIMRTQECENLDELFRMGGSSGGARPKVNYRMDGGEWIVKFASSYDRKDIGLQEYEYSLCAKECGIRMEETRLLPSGLCPGYFATRRFDRKDGRRIHMISAGALLETSHRIPNLDYHILMRLTLKLTNDYSQLEQLYRLMCFNVYAHNRDDHSKNFSFLYNEGQNKWELAPAYDLTYSNSIGGEHATTIDGNGRDPGKKELLAVAAAVKLDPVWAEAVREEIEEKVKGRLKKWLK